MQVNILVVIVLYGKTLEQAPSFQAISRQYDDNRDGLTGVYIHDNSPARDDGAAARTDVVYMHHPENKGLGYAYNKAAEWAADHNFDWLLLFDQDTVLPDNLLSSYRSAITDNPGIRLFVPQIRMQGDAFLSPGRIWHNAGLMVSNRSYPLRGAMIINSGMCVSLSLFHAAGGYEEKIWLDFSDTQFICKLSCLDKSYYLVPAICIQDFSGNETDFNKLKKRFDIYLQCARECQYFGLEDYLHRQWGIWRHTLALTIKTRNLSFFRSLFTDYII